MGYYNKYLLRQSGDFLRRSWGRRSNSKLLLGSLVPRELEKALGICRERARVLRIFGGKSVWLAAEMKNPG